jgi:hypothetical protein
VASAAAAASVAAWVYRGTWHAVGAGCCSQQKGPAPSYTGVLQQSVGVLIATRVDTSNILCWALWWVGLLGLFCIE